MFIILFLFPHRSPRKHILHALIQFNNPILQPLLELELPLLIEHTVALEYGPDASHPVDRDVVKLAVLLAEGRHLEQ